MPRPPQSLRQLAVLAALLAPVAAHAHGAFHERMAQLAARIERTPDDARAQFELAELFVRHGDWALALGAADSAEALRPGAFATDLIRGEAQLGAGRPAAARAALDRLLAQTPGHAAALMLRARARAALEDRAGALADYRAALDAAAPPADRVREAAAALAAAGHRDEAIAALARALAVPGPDPALLQDALALELAAGRFDDALARIAALELSAPRREPWQAQRARVLAAAQRPAEARAAWSDLLRHLGALPNLERGQPALLALAAEARAALAAP
jgi:predicted Zn-dependent protease